MHLQAGNVYLIPVNTELMGIIICIYCSCHCQTLLGHDSNITQQATDVESSTLHLKGGQHVSTPMYFHKRCLRGAFCASLHRPMLQRLRPEGHQQSHLRWAIDHTMSFARNGVKPHKAAYTIASHRVNGCNPLLINHANGLKHSACSS